MFLLDGKRMVDFLIDDRMDGSQERSQPPASIPSADSAAWASPPEPINQILDAPAFPGVLLSPNLRWMVELEHQHLQPISHLAEPEVAVAGFRLNPQTNGPARFHPYIRMAVKAMGEGTFQPVKLPEPSAIGFLRWSPDGDRLGFTLTTDQGFELWILDLATATAHRLTEPTLNATYGTPYRWLSKDAVLCKFIPSDRGEPPVKSAVPMAPVIQENFGKATPSRTYTNLLKDSHDEALFEYYVTSRLERVTLAGDRLLLVPPCLIDEAKPSPDGHYILLTTLERPYSYQLPAGRFPRRIQVIDTTGKSLYVVADVPLVDYLSTKFDAVRRGPRSVFWRSDCPATLYWTEALDEGEPTNEAEYRDALYEMDAPFQTQPKKLWRSRDRFRGVSWGRDDVALVWERWHDTRQQRIWQINPAQPETPASLVIERNYEDRYSDPGAPFTVLGNYGRDVLRFSADGNALFWHGRGASPEGVYPFLERRELGTSQTQGQTQRLWQSQAPYFESVVEILDDEANQLILSRQSTIEAPNYFLGSRDRTDLIPLTHNSDPAPEFAGIQRQVVRYERQDGVQLSAALYLPAGYDAKRDGPLPTVFWIYPEEFKSRELAGQVTMAEHTFTRPRGTSVLFLLTQGYAVLNNPSLPIIGEGEEEPNDRYVEQLLAGIEAAVEYVVNAGVSDRDRLGIGGHSYGAFTTANVLAHSNLFRAGVAMSGAYNRTLTPFGFQGEQRTFWDASHTYVQMSPFTHAGKISAPILLMHGANDSNSGTYPVQTERFFEALKGLGATARFVVLPLEDHGYRSREAVGHALWEIITWFNRYL